MFIFSFLPVFFSGGIITYIFLLLFTFGLIRQIVRS